MGKIMLTLPSRSGYVVTWDTGETMRNGKPQRKDFCTTDYDKALQKALELAEEGKQNIDIAEAIF